MAAAAVRRGDRSHKTAVPSPMSAAHHKMNASRLPARRAAVEPSSSSGSHCPSVVALAVVSRRYASGRRRGIPQRQDHTGVGGYGEALPQAGPPASRRGLGRPRRCRRQASRNRQHDEAHDERDPRSQDERTAQGILDTKSAQALQPCVAFVAHVLAHGERGAFPLIHERDAARLGGIERRPGRGRDRGGHGHRPHPSGGLSEGRKGRQRPHDYPTHGACDGHLAC